MKKYLCGFFLTMVFSQSLFAALPTFANYYYFGDSLTDMGNYIANPVQACVNVDAPVTNPTGSLDGYNNFVWVDDTGEGFGSATPGALSGSGYNGTPSGNNWAISGYETGYSSIDKTPGMVGETQNFVKVHAVDPNALYVLWAGSNDLIQRVFPQPPTAPTPPGVVIAGGMSNIVASVSNLYAAGARKFLIIGVPDISQTPLASNPTPNATYLIGLLFNYQKQVQEVCFLWNSVLFNSAAADAHAPGKAPLLYLKNKYPDIQIYAFNPFFLLDAIAADPSSFGYTTPVPDNNEVTWCVNGGNADSYIFFNYIHPTGYTHHLLAQYIRSNSALF